MIGRAVPTRAAYEAAFLAEQAQAYPVVEAYEARVGYAVDRARVEAAAAVLACPIKVHAPCWQHGRVLYATARARLAGHRGPATLIDVGTAKGFSALCLQWAVQDSGWPGEVTSVDVQDPQARVRRNTVAEVDGLCTLAEILRPWPEAAAIRFRQGTGAALLEQWPGRIHLAFLDGKHDAVQVGREVAALALRQDAGDVVVWDDLQVPGVRAAVETAAQWYVIERLTVLPQRGYAIGVRR